MPVNNMWTDEYCEENPEVCNIEPGGKRTVRFEAVPIECSSISDESDCESRDVCKWVESESEGEEDESEVSGTCEDYKDRRSRYVEARVRFSYDYIGQGDFDFIVAESDAAAETKRTDKEDPSHREGPVDVIVLMSPREYIFLEGEEEDVNIDLIIDLSKRKAGVAYIKDAITINRRSDGVLERPLDCSHLGDSYDLTPISDYSEKIDLRGTQRLDQFREYSCEYTIKYSKLNEEPDREEAELIHFRATAGYTYNKTITKSEIEVRRAGT